MSEQVIEITPTAVKEIWSKGEGADKRTIDVIQTADGKEYKTFSKKIAEEAAKGEPMEVENYQREGNRGTEEFVRGIKTDEGQSYGGGSSGGGSYQSSGSAAAKKGGNESFALSYAKDIEVANIANGNKLNEFGMFELADKMMAWMNGEKPVFNEFAQDMANYEEDPF